MLTAKWATFDRYGSPMPDWDQWDAEALETYVPWFTGDHFLTHLFTPHNEHRVVLTKLQNLGLVLLNGQWDSRLEALTNAALHSTLALAFWLLGRRVLAAQDAPAILRTALSALLFLLIFALFGLPVAWQNVLGGFHSQQYWLAALSFVAIVHLPFARSGSRAWWLAAGSVGLAMGSMGSGFLAATVVLMVLGWRLLRGEARLRDAWPAATVALALTVVGILTRHEVPWHADLKAKTVHDFVFTIVHSLEWPWRDRHWLGLVLWLPWLLLAWRVARLARTPTDPAAAAHAPSALPQIILALGGWVLIQLAATGYARGAGADYPASRYMDTLTFGALANALALAWLLVAPAEPRRGPAFLFRSVAALGWIVALGLGLHTFLAHTVRWELIEARRYYTKSEAIMRRYLATNDARYLAEKDIPFPSADGLVERLAIPSLRALMPVPLRTPLPVTAATDASRTGGGTLSFLENNAIGADIERPPRLGLSPPTPPLDYTRTWGSFAAPDASAPRTWRSKPVTPTRFAWLRFETAGQLRPGAAGLSLQLRDAATDEVLGEVRPNRTPGDSWRSAYARMPARPFVIVASDAASAEWMAFSPPAEMAWLSFAAWQAAKHALLAFWFVLGLTILCVLGLALRRPARGAA